MVCRYPTRADTQPGPAALLCLTPIGNYQTASPIKMDDMTSRKALAADMMIRVDGTWDSAVFWDDGVPAHGSNSNGSNAPKGGNHSFADGSGAWIPYTQTYSMHSWSPGARQAYWFQEDLPEDAPVGAFEATSPTD